MPPIFGARASARVSLSERGPFLFLWRRPRFEFVAPFLFITAYDPGSEVAHLPDVVYRLRDHFGLFVQVTS